MGFFDKVKELKHQQNAGDVLEIPAAQQLAAQQVVKQQVPKKKKAPKKKKNQQEIVQQVKAQQQVVKQQITIGPSIVQQVEKLDAINYQQLLAKQQQNLKTVEEQGNTLLKNWVTKKKKQVSVEEFVEGLKEGLDNAIEEREICLNKINEFKEIIENDALGISKKQIQKYKSLITKYTKLWSSLDSKIVAAQAEIERQTFKQKSDEITVADVSDAVEALEEATGEDLSDVDTNKLVTQIETAIEEIPDGDAIEITDVVITKGGKKDKTGYFKTKVNISKNNIPNIVNSIASYVKQQTKGVIKPRVVDLRVIGNTNKTQLRNKDLKLTTRTVVFKPMADKLKVNKGTRIMISVPENYSDSNPSLIVYLQESRAKSIIQIGSEGFNSVEAYVNFIGDQIARYYTLGYESTMHRLQLRGEHNPFLEVIQKVLNTRDYKVKIMSDPQGDIHGFFIATKGTDNEWLEIVVRETEVEGKYEVVGRNTVSNDEYQIIKSDTVVTEQWLQKNLVALLNSAYKRDWSNEIQQAGFEPEYYMSRKLTHKKLRDVLVKLINEKEEKPELGIEIIKAVSKNEMRMIQDDNYDAETLAIRTAMTEYVFFTYYAPRIHAGDTKGRNGRNYITTQQYYEKYDVRDRRSYENRDRVIPRREEGKERNYHARPYVMMMKYKPINGNEITLVSKDYGYLLNESGLLNDSLNRNPKSEIDLELLSV